MKLSELVGFKNELDRLSILPSQQSTNEEVSKINHLIDLFPVSATKSNLFAQCKDELLKKFTEFENHLNDLKLSIKQEIEVAERPWLSESYRLYEKEMIYETVEYTLNRRPNITEETREFYRTRIMRRTDWKIPAMIIRPGLESYINDMVACDPLYIIDEQYELLTPALSQFNEVYKNRLRPYTINERSDNEILYRLPDNQFGLVLAYNFFNFRPFEVIRRYLDEIYQKLRPGGVILMTINDCDRDKGVILVEQHFACYTPGSMVIEYAKSIGFDLDFTWTDYGPSTWIELKKPGELTTLRGGQTLAKIVSK